MTKKEPVPPQNADPDWMVELDSRIVESLPYHISILGPDYRYRRVNGVYEKAHGLSSRDIIGTHVAELLGEQVFEATIKPHFDACMSGKDVHYEAWFPFRLKGNRFMSVAYRPLRNRRGAIDGVLVISRDLTEQKRAEMALRESELRFRQLAENIRDVFWVTDRDKKRMLYVSPAYEEIWGRTCESLYERPMDFLDAIHPDDRARVKSALPSQVHGTYNVTYRIVRPDGSLRWIRDRAFPVREESGQVDRLVGIAEDITELIEREEQLRQSQRLKAVGQLTGGIAHDFNNLLAIILGNAEILQESLGAGSETDRSLVGAILKASERGAELTSRLLAFSRQQTLVSKITDVSALVTDMIDMLERTLGEAIEVEANLAVDAWPTWIDQSQLENTLLNLAINARDAMPEGGTLTIEVSNVHLGEDYAAKQGDISAGDYVKLSVTDTGSGMSPEVIEHAFEPFFTTKNIGEGSGLGLSTAYGFVKQSNGHITIESKVGWGSTVSLYLPRSEAAVPEAQPPVAAKEPVAQGETLLVVEDDEGVRQVIVTVLRRLGYQILEARDGEEALEVLKGSPKVDLLLTDVVLPLGQTGPAIVAEARHHRPNLKCLFISGYAPEGVAHQYQSLQGIMLLQKPVTKRVLAQKVRMALDG